VVDSPSQILEDDADTLSDMEPLTNTVTEAVVEQPLVVPVTEYVVVTEGLTAILAPGCPVLQLYEPAPLAVSVVVAPAQMMDGEALTEITGLAFTVTLTLAVAEQPLALVPVTLYVVLAFGLTTIFAPVWPLLQV
jgi:hypothetical protein